MNKNLNDIARVRLIQSQSSFIEIDKKWKQKEAKCVWEQNVASFMLFCFENI